MQPARRVRTAWPTTPPPGGVVLSGATQLRFGAVLAGAVALAACTAPPSATAPAGDATVAIAAIQGDGPSSPLLGQRVAIESVVSASFGGLGGVFVQDPRGDQDASTSEALFVRWSGHERAPSPGSRVRVEGVVAEFGEAPHTLTGIAAERIESLGKAPLPAPLPLRAPPADWEPLEGMRVRIDTPLTVTGNHALQRYGELAVAFGGRIWQPTELHPPGPKADALAKADAARSLLLDDGRSRENPRTLWQLPQPLSADAPLRAGSRATGVEGVVDQRFGAYRIQPTAPFAAIEQAPRPAPPAIEAPLRLAVFNVLNFFDGDGHGGGFPTTRGASTPEAFAHQRDKLVAALLALDADIVALLEIENDGNGPDSSLATLVCALNAAQAGDEPGARYRHVATPAPGGDAIRVGLLYRPARVVLAGRTAQLDTGPFAYGSRPPLAQAFDLGAGAPLVVAVNHFKSKGGCDKATGANADRGDHQACFNGARVAAAEALAAWLARDPTGTGSPRVLVVGDLNAYAAEDPLRALHAHGFRDTFAATGATPDYSYVYQGRAGRLDHVLASEAALPLVTAVAAWHANADEATAFAYTAAAGTGTDATDGVAYRPDPWRASDHDPLLVGLSPAR